ncbi:SDR family oxidoreductase [Companilactobacillus allii]|uniref:NAD(P)-binding domain-containing protein n=1 Tax=Companilactobacillus allii TaxID=1847728 RepID=A0A1P8Q325_9LACO|nr:NAD(P)-binding oxidoreductase [Companilactobacillus allii]APX72219.1 hypothetical protein BTM29_06445 [Companilactobacillus allii]USQ69312.1 SDR family oxidoreductase [Companilactobacillus allii]
MNIQITIFGATGSIGPFLIDKALDLGHTIISASRKPQNDTTDGVKSIVVDYGDTESIKKALVGSDAVIIALGGSNILEPTKNILHTLETYGPKKVEMITGFGSDKKLRKELPLSQQVMFNAMKVTFSAVLKVMSQQVEIIRNTNGLDWLNVQPPWLTYDEKTDYRYGVDIKSTVNSKLSRLDLADFMITQLSQNELGKKSVNIVGSTKK